MSALVGMHCLSGQPADRADLDRMVACLAHRGPDGAGAWSDGPVGLGHLMLHTTPESVHETLPRANPAGDLVITADARIDNRDELLRLLEPRSSCVSGEVSDSELILAAYEQWGEGCPERLLGDFAFAIWDSRKETLFCARDHFGVKPFYYYASGDLFAFATEIKALFCLGRVPRRLNEVRVGDFLVGFEDPAITFFQDVLRLPPAHCMTVSRDGTRLRSYWALDPSREIRLKSDEAYAEALRELFVEAVRCRMRSAFPVGSMMSGGLDSSAIACTARRLLSQNGQERLHTFSAVFDTVTECDERHFQNAVLAENDVVSHVLHADQASPLGDLDRVLWHQDEAMRAGNLYLAWNLYAPAQQHGVRVILDGFDGDSTISHGDGYLTELAHAGRWLTLTKEARAYALRLDQPWKEVVWSWMWSFGLDPLITGSPFLSRVRRGWQLVTGSVGRPSNGSTSRAAWEEIVRADFAGRIGLPERLRTRPAPPKTEREQHHRRLTHAGMPYTLETVDRAAAAFSIEPRFPFWDKRLAEFCLALPPEQKLRNGWNRWVMRRAMYGILPREVQWRGRKTDVHPAFERGLRAFERERLGDVIMRDDAVVAEYVDLAALREIYRQFVARAAAPDEVNAMWRAACLGLWLRRAGLTLPSKERR